MQTPTITPIIQTTPIPKGVQINKDFNLCSTDYKNLISKHLTTHSTIKDNSYNSGFHDKIFNFFKEKCNFIENTAKNNPLYLNSEKTSLITPNTHGIEFHEAAIPLITLIGKIFKIYFLTESIGYTDNKSNFFNPVIFQNCKHVIWNYKMIWDKSNKIIYQTESKEEYEYNPGADLDSLWKAALEKKFTDITISVNFEGKEKQYLYAHKSILQIKSIWFQTAINFQQGQGKDPREIEITNFPYEICKIWLEFIYTNTNRDIKQLNFKNACQLFELAHQFEEKSLLKYCGYLIKECMEQELIHKKENFECIFNLSLTYEMENFLVDCLKCAQSKEATRDLLYTLITEDNYEKLMYIAIKNKLDGIKDCLMKKTIEFISPNNKRKNEVLDVDDSEDNPLKK